METTHRARPSMRRLRSITIVLHVFHAVPRAASMSRIVLTRTGEARAAYSLDVRFCNRSPVPTAIRWDLSRKRKKSRENVCPRTFHMERQISRRWKRVYLRLAGFGQVPLSWILVLFSVADSSTMFREIRQTRRIWIWIGNCNGSSRTVFARIVCFRNLEK